MTKSSSLSLPLANLSTALGKQGETTEPSRVKFTQQNNATTAPAALNNGAFIGKSEFQELKNLLLEKHDSQNRHFDACPHTKAGSKKSRPARRNTTSKDKRGTATLFYLWTNWPSCNQLPRMQRAKPSRTASRIISRSQT